MLIVDNVESPSPAPPKKREVVKKERKVVEKKKKPPTPPPPEPEPEVTTMSCAHVDLCLVKLDIYT